MNHGTVRIILEKVISSPANVNLPEFDEAIRWVEDRLIIRRLNMRTDRDEYGSQFHAAAIEMRVLRRLLARRWFAGTTESAQHVLRLLGREVSLLDMARSKGIDLWERGLNKWERGLNKLRHTPPQTQTIVKLSFRYVISILR